MKKIFQAPNGKVGRVLRYRRNRSREIIFLPFVNMMREESCVIERYENT